MKTHISLETNDLDESVRFYSTLLNATPLKHYNDYALFVASDPGLELALRMTPSRAGGNDAHYGIAVETNDAVDAAIGRMQTAGFPLDIETEETCCYAKQNKVWATDPDGRRWETYVVLEEVEPDAAGACCR